MFVNPDESRSKIMHPIIALALNTTIKLNHIDIDRIHSTITAVITTVSRRFVCTVLKSIFTAKLYGTGIIANSNKKPLCIVQ